MLSEAFLSTIMYEKTLTSRQDKELGHRSSLKHSRHSVLRGEEGRSSRMRSVVAGNHGDLGPRPESSSQAMAIPSRDLTVCCSLDLYTSWSSRYASIYKNYPDLHIGGDHILTKKDSGCVLECEDGPVLLSVDIDSRSPPKDLLEGPQQEGPLHSMEVSNVLPAAPFSNSVLNGYLEKKMQELYKQCYEETLATNKSINAPMVNLHQMSLIVSQEQNIDQAKAREAILQYLSSATSGGSSEFITPVLHISNQDSKKRWSNLSKKLCP